MVYREERSGHRFLGCLFQRDHHRREAPPKSLDSLPLAIPTPSQTMTYWHKLLVVGQGEDAQALPHTAQQMAAYTRPKANASPKRVIFVVA